MRLKSYKHIPIKEANKLQKDTKNIKLKVTTINWTYATKKGKTNYDEVHINIYESNLAKMVRWIKESEGYMEIKGKLESYCIGEDIINIEVLK